MEEKTVLINNLKVHYSVAGSGPAILILHGWGGSSFSWKRIQEIIAKKEYMVICPDFPGFGKSKTPQEPWDVSDYTTWTLDFIKSQNLKRFFVISHSFGGRIAIRLASRYPEIVKALVFCNSAGIKHNLSLKTKMILALAKIGNMIFSPKLLAGFKDAARNFFYIFLRHKDYVKANGTMKETMKRVLAEDLQPYLSKIKTKTLIIWGKKDKILPLRDAYVFKEKIKDSKLQVLPNVGHSPHLELPEKLANIILNFLND